MRKSTTTSPHPNPLPQGEGEQKSLSLWERVAEGRVRRREGFTLIELMLVVIIIGTLAAMIVPRFAGRSEEAKKTAAKADVNANIANALEMYELDTGSLPTTDAGLQALITPPTGPQASRWKGPYVKKKGFKDPWGNPYQYRQVDSKTFELSSMGPDGTPGTSDDIRSGDE